MVNELSDLTVEDLSKMFIGNDEKGHRLLTPHEAQNVYDMVHQTERAKKTFEMTDVEYARAQEFAKEHGGCRSGSATSEKFEYTFLPGGIGTCVTIKCVICGKEKNITDYDCW